MILLVIECLNGYRPKRMSQQIMVILQPQLVFYKIVKYVDITVSYGSTFNLCEQASEVLEEMNISCELIDVQTLLPFDINHMIVNSLKTNRIIFIDEDVPGGATFYAQ